MTLDEIYESFIWDSSYTDEEYESKISVGINEAKKYKYLYPFIQPIIPEKSKCIWEPCARIVALKTDDESENRIHSINISGAKVFTFGNKQLYITDDGMFNACESVFEEIK